MPEKDELDLLLDSALSTYADPGPGSGLEQRVLSALVAARAEQAPAAKPPRRWLPWGIAIPFTACLLILLLWIPGVVHAPVSTPRIAERQQPPMSIASTAPAPKPHPKTAHPSHPATSGRHPSTPAQVVHATPLPKLDVFPTPTPLSQEERALVAVAGTGTPSERQALMESQKPSDAPLSIAALNIPPLAAPGDGKN